MAEPSRRRPWTEGPVEDAPPESWLGKDDDELLHRIETLDPSADEDEQLLDVVASDRHFFIRQEAAKRIRDRNRLFAFEDDRYVGQILVRHMNRREDITYLERLCARSRHVEVRSAAQVQLARLWSRLEGSTAAAPPATPGTSAALEPEGVDGSLLGWAAHFVVEQAWSHLGTQTTRELLGRTRRDLVGRHPTLVFFEVTRDAHVSANLSGGLRLPRDAVAAVAAWMAAFRAAACAVAPEMERTSVRDAGFYAACAEVEGRS